MDIEDIQQLLGDERPEMRALGVQILAESASPLVDGLLLKSVVDPAPAVGEVAAAALTTRYPWLGLDAFEPRPMPDAALVGPPGTDWTRLREEARRVLASPPAESDDVERWLALPGLIPDVVELLDEMDRPEAARRLDRTADGWIGDRPGTTQILLSPTYRCNLDCEYCYAREWRQAYPPDMSRESLVTALSWAKSAGCETVILSGGEPTQYRYFSELLVEAEARDLAVVLTSNGVYAPGLRPLIDGKYVREFVAHYDQDLAGPDRRRHRTFAENLRSARDAGVDVMLRYTLTPASGPGEWGPLLDLGTDLGILRLNYGVASPSVSGGAAHFTPEALTDPDVVGSMVERLRADTEGRGMRLWLCKPVALCAFTTDGLREMIPAGVVRSACDAFRRSYSSNVTINPDLSTFPCSVLGVEGPAITEFSDLAEVGGHNEEFIRSLLHEPLVPACRSCFYWYRGLCQGACLVHQLRGGKARRSEIG